MQHIIDFILETDRLKTVERKTRPRGLERFENSAEHSWQLALAASALASFAEPGVDINRVVRMLLIHDLGEIDTGDTIVYAEEGWEERKAAELVAVTRMFAHLPEPASSEMLALWREFEAGETKDSRFANAIDRAMPVILNLENQGQSWRENGITHERVVKRVAPQIRNGCPALWEHLEGRLAAAFRDGWFGIA
jgi:putative hydrolase of HD superfamily